MTASREHVAFKAGLVGLMAYEVAAITTSRLPTVSQLCRAHRSVEVALLAMLLGHLHCQLPRGCACGCRSCANGGCAMCLTGPAH